MIHVGERLVFLGRDGYLKIDAWLELFRMAHTFDFKGRLELDSPTLPLSDLLSTGRFSGKNQVTNIVVLSECCDCPAKLRDHPNFDCLSVVY